MAFVPNAIFYSTLLLNLYLAKRNSWKWFVRIDATVVLGGLPFRWIAQQLNAEENIGGVVCMNMEHEVNHSWVFKQSDWEALGIRYRWLPVDDYFYAPKVADIVALLDFITEVGREGKSVYVHCKAGRTRSATIVVCYLMQKHNWTPVEAFSYLQKKRPQLWFTDAQWNVVNEFRKLRHQTLEAVGPSSEDAGEDNKCLEKSKNRSKL